MPQCWELSGCAQWLNTVACVPLLVAMLPFCQDSETIWGGLCPGYVRRRLQPQPVSLPPYANAALSFAVLLLAIITALLSVQVSRSVLRHRVTGAGGNSSGLDALGASIRLAQSRAAQCLVAACSAAAARRM